MMTYQTVQRFREVVVPLAPLRGYRIPIDLLGNIDTANVFIVFDPIATQAQKDTANAALASFDWSDVATQAYLDAQDPDKAALIQAATNAIQDNLAFLALPSPTNTQAVAQVQKLAQQNIRVIKRLVEIL